jgi:IS30 family transposase
MYSTKGRPRLITDAQVAAILEWHRNRKTLRKFAAELGLKRSTIQRVIERNGQYKQPSPEKRGLVVSRRQLRMQRLRKEGWL